jgi:hypothetical protein
LGKQLYEEYVKVKDFLGLDDGQAESFSDLEDLTDLMEEIRSFTKTALDGIPAEFQPSDDNPTDQGVVGTVLGYLGTGGFGITWGNKTILSWNDFNGPLPGGNGDQINVAVAKDAVSAGTVRFVLALGNNVTSWKGIEFIRVDRYNNESKIGLLECENDRWAIKGQLDPQTGKMTSSPIDVPSAELKSTVLEFQKAALAGYWTGYYRLRGLDQIAQIQDGSQVTFTWIAPTDS